MAHPDVFPVVRRVRTLQKSPHQPEKLLNFIDPSLRNLGECIRESSKTNYKSIRKISMNIWEELVFAAALYATLKIVKRKIAVPTTAGFLSALFVKEFYFLVN